MQKTSDTFLFVERYRPKTVNDCILPAQVKNEINAYIAKGEISNMIFSGTAGVGKTTVARAIAHELGADLLYLNLSSENGIDVIRNQISQFASTASFEGNLKIVIGDECLVETERVRVGSIDSWVGMQLKDMERDVPYPIVSFNIETREFENDIAYIASDRVDELFEVELEDGSTIIANKKHPFMCIDLFGNVVERTIEEGFHGVSIIKSS